ncbi:hypothetical protein B9Z55_013306 [Caenorhabditis nigoni]|nr:hypothetical protein B9Z55_013306 [Caenorhabditis nigoni]
MSNTKFSASFIVTINLPAFELLVALCLLFFYGYRIGFPADFVLFQGKKKSRKKNNFLNCATRYKIGRQTDSVPSETI